MAKTIRLTVRRGLDLPVAGQPRQAIGPARPVTRVAILGRDYRGMRLGPFVEPGASVALGQPLLQDRGDPRIVCTAPGAGVVEAIHRGERRSLQSVVIRLEGDAETRFAAHADRSLASLPREVVVSQLCEAGLWQALRQRPYNVIPSPDDTPFAITVTAMDSNPLAPDPRIAISGAQGAFADGLRVLERLTDGVLYVCTAPAAALPVPDSPRTVVAEFDGPHPAGLPGTHIHMLCPVDAHRSVWHIGYQDVIAVGGLFTTGRLSTERIIALGGPPLKDPRLLRTRTGAHIPGLIAGGCAEDDEIRVIAGSVLAGTAVSDEIAFLGRYDNQVSVLREGREREFLSWLSPGASRWSVTNAFVSALRRHKPFGFNTSQNGSERAMVPIGSYERVVPLDILPTQLLRALLVGDAESALALGCLELAEEDLALCTVVCPSKYDYGPVLRTVLDTIRKEG